MCDCHAQISHNNVKVASFLATKTSAKLLQMFYACLKKRTIISENLQLEGHEAMKSWHCTLHLNKNPDTQQPDNKSFKLNNQMFYLFSPFVQHWQVISDLIINAWLSRTAGRHLGWNDRCCSFFLERRSDPCVCCSNRLFSTFPRMPFYSSQRAVVDLTCRVQAVKTI